MPHHICHKHDTTYAWQVIPWHQPLNCHNCMCRKPFATLVPFFLMSPTLASLSENNIGIPSVSKLISVAKFIVLLTVFSPGTVPYISSSHVSSLVVSWADALYTSYNLLLALMACQSRKMEYYQIDRHHFRYKNITHSSTENKRFSGSHIIRFLADGYWFY